MNVQILNTFEPPCEPPAVSNRCPQVTFYPKHVDFSVKILQPRSQGFLLHALSVGFRAEKCSAQTSVHPLSQAHGGLFFDCVRLFVCLSLRESLTNTE